ncbi:ParB/RepB/Spo0J family partition protein [Methylocystis hirsuta]|nr:ParB/RepB/Spo0J family partition protein [Methylocystis hirsuta]
MNHPAFVTRRDELMVPVRGLHDPRKDEPLDSDTVRLLAQSIREQGFTSRVLVYTPELGMTCLIAGRHRLEAAKRAGLTAVPALRLTFSEPGWQSVSKERADAWENVARRDLTAAERMFREAELHEIRMRDATKTRPDEYSSGRNDQGRGGNTHLRTGLRDSARELGIDRISLSESVRFAKMDPKIVEEAVQAGVDGRVKLAQLARVPKERQREAIPAFAKLKMQEGAKDARRLATKFGAPAGKPRHTNETPRPTERKEQEADYLKLLHTWNAAPNEAKLRIRPIIERFYETEDESI